MVLDFQTNVACRGSDQRGPDWPHVGSVGRLAHGRGVGHEDEPDEGMRLHKEGQELLTDVHGTHVHEADPWGSGAIGVHNGGVQPCEVGCEGRRRRPVALRMQRSVVLGGFHGGDLSLKNELGMRRARDAWWGRIR